MRKLYVLVRADLSKSQQAVQAGHAVAAFMCEWNHWSNEILVYLKVRGEAELASWRDRIAKSTDIFSEFREPDIGDQLTAIAVTGDGIGDIVAELPLL